MKFFLLCSLIFSGCAFKDDGSASNNAREQRDRDNLNKIFAPVLGTYEGQFTGNDPSQKVLNAKIGLYTQEEKVGTDPNGEDIVRPVLFAKLEIDLIPDYDTFLRGKYFPETGELTLTNIKGKDSVGIQSIRLVLSATQGAGDLQSVGGSIGKLNLVKTNAAYQAPTQGDLYDRNERLRKIYTKAIGEYRGKMFARNPTKPQEAFKEILLKFYIRDLKTTDGSVRPFLIAYYEIVGEPIDIGRTMVVQYRTEKTPEEVSMASDPSGPMSYQISISAVIKENLLIGTLSNQQGYIADFKLSKKDESYHNPNPAEASRFRLISGRYVGTYKKNGEANATKIIFTLTTDELKNSDGSVYSVLRATSITPNDGDLSQRQQRELEVKYLPLQDSAKIEMLALPESAGKGFKITAVLNKSTLSGVISYQGGDTANFTAKK